MRFWACRSITHGLGTRWPPRPWAQWSARRPGCIPAGARPRTGRGRRSSGRGQPLPGVDPPSQRPGRTGSAEPIMSPWKIAAAQLDCRLGAVEDNLAAVRSRLAEAADTGARLVVFPECALTGYGFASRAEA